MNLLVKLRLTESNRITQNYHFWITIAVFIAFALLYYFYYYTDIFPSSSWRALFWHLAIFEYKYDVYGCLFYIPIIYAAFAFWWRGSIILPTIFILLTIPHVVYQAPNYTSLLSGIVFLVIPYGAALFIVFESKWKGKERRISEERDQERQTYISQIIKVQEEERQRIAQELHDDTMQTLIAIANYAQDIVSDDIKKNALRVKEQSELIRDTILHVAKDLRELSLELRPNLLDDMGLVPAIRWLAHRMDKEGGIKTKLKIKGENLKPSADTDVILFRIVQEALTNIRRHSGAKEAEINLEFGLETIKITIKDNGKGFVFPRKVSKFATSGKLGLIGMLERIKFLNGVINIDSRPGNGTIISIECKQ